jgi:hypothetical protein
MLGIAPESPASGARFVSCVLDLKQFLLLGFLLFDFRLFEIIHAR